jgi:biotin synthase-like enzyme
LKDVPKIGTQNFAKLITDTTIVQTAKEFKNSGHKFLIVESDKEKPISFITKENLREKIKRLSPI